MHFPKNDIQISDMYPIMETTKNLIVYSVQRTSEIQVRCAQVRIKFTESFFSRADVLFYLGIDFDTIFSLVGSVITSQCTPRFFTRA